MKYYLFCFLLLWQLMLSAQSLPLISDYYFQFGTHEYSFYDIDDTILNLEGDNVVWDFSNGQATLSNITITYQYDTISGNEIYGYLPFYGTYLRSDLDDANRLLIKSFSPGYAQYQVLKKKDGISLVKRGIVDCDTGGLTEINTLNPPKLFPNYLYYQNSFTEPIEFIINIPEKDTITSTNSFSYTGRGTFIHPNGQTFCNVIQVKRIFPNHLGNLEETITWYSRDTCGPLASFTKAPSNNTGKHRVEIKEINTAIISFRNFNQDTLTYAHTTKNCGFTLDFYPQSSCDGVTGEEDISIDLWNDGSIDATATPKHLNFQQYNLAIGIHRIIFHNPFSKEIIEQIVVITDNNPPEIGGFCDGNGYYKEIPKDSSDVLIEPTDLFTDVSDNNCRDSLRFRFWFSAMEMEGIPHPDSLTIEQILDSLPDNYYVNCTYEREQYFSGLIYAFDSAGNWSRRNTSILIASNNCIYDCPLITSTQLSFQDLEGQPIIDINGLSYKTLVFKDSLYQLQICPDDTLATDFRLVIWQEQASITEGVSTFDLLLIRKHILGITPFTTFQQFAAADVNFSGDVTAFDLLLIKEAILGMRQLFPYATNWVFFEKETGLLDKHPNIDVFPEQLLAEKRFALRDTTYHFLGIKLGDVSQ